MLTVLEHHAEPLAASNTTFKIDTRDEQLEKAALRDPLQIPPNALARGSICPGSERPVRHCFPHHRCLRRSQKSFFCTKSRFFVQLGARIAFMRFQGWVPTR